MVYMCLDGEAVGVDDHLVAPPPMEADLVHALMATNAVAHTGAAVENMAISSTVRAAFRVTQVGYSH